MSNLEIESVQRLWRLYMGSIYKLEVEHLGPYQKLRRQIVDWAGVSPNHVIVDAGCGTGAIMQEFIDRGHSGPIYGFDRDEEALRVAKERFVGNTNVRIIHRDLDRKDAMVSMIGEGVADRVISNLSLYALHNPGQTIEESWRLLKPGGLFIVNNLFNPDVDAVVAAHECWLKDEANDKDREYHQAYLWAYEIMILINRHIKRLSHEGTFHHWPLERLVSEMEAHKFMIELTDASTYAGTSCAATGRRPNNKN